MYQEKTPLTERSSKLEDLRTQGNRCLVYKFKRRKVEIHYNQMQYLHFIIHKRNSETCHLSSNAGEMCYIRLGRVGWATKKAKVEETTIARK